MRGIIKQLTYVLVILSLAVSIFSYSDCITYADSNSGVSDFVTRLYEVTLERSPDSNGLQAWSSKLINGENTGVATAYGFIMSDEFQNKGYSNSKYIDLMYQAFFGRVADAAGKEAWVDQLNRGVSKEEIFAGFANSQEFYYLCKSYGVVAGSYIMSRDVDQTAKINLFVQRLYTVVLGRDCDMSGMYNWTNQLLSGDESGAGVAYGFFFSDEYRNKNKSDYLFLKDLYKALMNREPDDLGLYQWGMVFNGGADDGTIFNGFTGSDEFNSICASYGIGVGFKTNQGESYARIDRQRANSSNPNQNSNANISNNNSNPSNNANNLVKVNVNPLDYTYEVYSIGGTFNKYFYIKTDNPNPYSFRLLDPDSEYYSQIVFDDYLNQHIDYHGECYKEIIPITKAIFQDVVYENRNTGRVHGGYIATSGFFDIAYDNEIGMFNPIYSGYVDGRDLILETAEYLDVSEGGLTNYDRTFSYENNYTKYTSTAVHVSCGKFSDQIGFLVDTYASPNKSFWQNMDAIQAALSNYAAYPIGVADRDWKFCNYPFLAVSPYYEMQLNEHAETSYSLPSQSLLMSSYPFMLDSLSFPWIMEKVAYTLDSRAVVTDGTLHQMINVTLNGVTKQYGGAGGGYPTFVYTDQIERSYTFNGSNDDYFTKSFAEQKELLLNYYDISTRNSDEALASLRDGFNRLVGEGCWIRVADEISESVKYTYSDRYYGYTLENCWVDGRYINIYNYFEKGVSFEETLINNPSFVINNMTYVNYYGETVTRNVLFKYDAAHDSWYGYRAYYDQYCNDRYEDVPEFLKFTRSQVVAMNLDYNRNSLPTHGLIFDGTTIPGSPF